MEDLTCWNGCLNKELQEEENKLEVLIPANVYQKRHRTRYLPNSVLMVCSLIILLGKKSSDPKIYQHL